MRKNEDMLKLSRLTELLSYDEGTGVFVWRVYKGPNARPGQIAGQFDRDGYRLITIDQMDFYAHRLAWFYVFGVFPGQKEIDHINRCPGDNRISNLRLAERWQQRGNQKVRADSKSGVKGVQRKKGKWAARITRGGVVTRLGVFETIEEASAAYIAAAKAQFEAFARAS